MGSDDPTGGGRERAPASGSELYERVSRMVLPGEKTTPRADRGVDLDGPQPTRRVIERTLAPRSHPLPVPNGWYAIVESAELGAGDIISLTALDRDLIAFRDADGEARVFDAHCPHLGAHLGGGRVSGETIKCPYHGWHFGPDGGCVQIPYCDSRIPARARVRSYPVDEQDGFVHAWYHAADAPPPYRLPSIDEVTDPAWTDAHPWHVELVAALQEMAENNVDYAHLRYVHRREEVPAESSVFTTDGPFSRVVEALPEGPTFTRDTYGPGVAVLRVPDLMTLIATTTPIDRGTCRLRWHFFFPQAMADAADDLIEGVTGPYGLQADVPIWRDKIYRERPVLVKGDGPIAEFRRWYQQFYEGVPSPAE